MHRLCLLLVMGSMLAACDQAVDPQSEQTSLAGKPSLEESCSEMPSGSNSYSDGIHTSSWSQLVSCSGHRYIAKFRYPVDPSLVYGGKVVATYKTYYADGSANTDSYEIFDGYNDPNEVPSGEGYREAVLDTYEPNHSSYLCQWYDSPGQTSLKCKRGYEVEFKFYMRAEGGLYLHWSDALDYYAANN